MTNLNLLPCPFCSGEGHLADCKVHEQIYLYVVCDKCQGKNGPYETKEEAIKAWNIRATDAKYQRVRHFLMYISNETHTGFWDTEWACNKAKELLKEISQDE